MQAPFWYAFLILETASLAAKVASVNGFGALWNEAAFGLGVVGLVFGFFARRTNRRV
jgi:hypothetical protein